MISVAIFSSIYSLIFLLGEIVRKWIPQNPELSRKIVHLLCGLVSISLPYFIKSHWTVLLLVVLFSALMLFSKRINLLQSIHGISRKSQGSFYYPLAIYLLFFLSSNKPEIYVISILVLTISDAFAALIGSSYGRVKFDVEGNFKSLEGSAVFFFLTFLCVHIPLLLMTDIGRIDSLLIGFIIAILITGFEAISPSGSDNLIIPFGAYFLLNKMTSIPLHLVVEDLYVLVIIAAITALLSQFRPSGLIGMMLLNYAAITLCDFYWFFPLFIGQMLFYLFTFRERGTISLKPLFYLGLIPTLLIFGANAASNKSLFYLPYLTAVTGEALLVYTNYAKKTTKPRSVLFLSFTLLSLPLFFYFPVKQVEAFLILLIGSVSIYLINRRFIGTLFALIVVFLLQRYLCVM